LCQNGDLSVLFSTGETEKSRISGVTIVMFFGQKLSGEKDV
jgi:hypothetical protein